MPAGEDRMKNHQHISLFGPATCTCTEQEAANLELVTRYRAAKVSERSPFLAPGFVRHRAGFSHIGEMFGLEGSAGMNDDSIADRQNILIELTAKDDKVWGIFRIVGTHTGTVYGIPATGKPINVIEAALWRVEGGLIQEAWYFGDELGLLRQLDVKNPLASS
jgi:predicted ester cyclase